MLEKKDQAGHIFLMLVVFTWGANYGIVKSALRDFSPVLFAALRFTLCGTLVLLLTLKQEKGVIIRREDIKRVALVGLLGIGAYQALWSIGLDLTSASNSALILSTTPLWGSLYVHLVQKESIGKKHYLYMMIALSGVFLVMLKPTVRLHFSLDTLVGDLLNLMATFCGAIFLSAWSKPLLLIYSPLRLMGYCMIFGSVILWLAVPFYRASVPLSQVGMTSWLFLGYAVFFSGMIGHVSYYTGIQKLGVARSMIYLYFVPLWALLFNAFFLGERIYLQQVLGGILILFSTHRALRSS